MKITPWLLVIFFFLCANCNGTPRPAAKLSDKVERDAPIPNSEKELKEEIKNVRARLRLLDGALEDERVESAQTKLWISAGSCWLAALVLFGIGLWTSRAILVQLAAAAAGLGALLLVTAWLVPYAYFIGAGAVLLMVGIAVYMLCNRDSTLTKVVKGVEKLKTHVPGYRKIMKSEMTKGADSLVGHIRATRIRAHASDPTAGPTSVPSP